MSVNLFKKKYFDRKAKISKGFFHVVEDMLTITVYKHKSNATEVY